MSSNWATIELLPEAKLPARSTSASAGFDVFAHLIAHTTEGDEMVAHGREIVMFDQKNARLKRAVLSSALFPDRWSVGLPPGFRALVPLGFKCRIPYHLEAQLRPRSGLALTKGLEVVNSPGTIDADYPGEWAVVLRNESAESYELIHGEKIAQVVFNQFEVVRFHPGAVGVTTDRTGGFGSTGT